MSNNIIMRRIALSGDWQALSTLDVEVATVDVAAPPTNAAPAVFAGDDDSAVPWVPGEWHSFVRVNLAELRVKGQAGDIVTVVGGTW